MAVGRGAAGGLRCLVCLLGGGEEAGAQGAGVHVQEVVIVPTPVPSTSDISVNKVPAAVSRVTPQDCTCSDQLIDACPVEGLRQAFNERGINRCGQDVRLASRTEPRLLTFTHDEQ